MTRIVLDTNVIVSALLKPRGNEAAVLLLALRGSLELYISEAVLAEYGEILRRPRLRLPAREVAASLAAIRATGRLVHPAATLAKSPHESDNRFYECAEAAEAGYIVTGNTRHFKKSHGKTKIVTARKLLDILATSQR